MSPSLQSNASRRRARERAARRRSILEAAIPEFAEHGPAGASMDAIARRAGLGKATLYYYFSTKEALYAAALEHAAERFFSGLLPPDGELPASLDGLVGLLLERFVAFCREEPELLAVMAPFLVRMARRALGVGGAAEPAEGRPGLPPAHRAFIEALEARLTGSPWEGRRYELAACLTDAFLVLSHRALAGQVEELGVRAAFYRAVVARPPHFPEDPR